MSPVNAYLTPVLEQAFAPLIGRGFLRFVQGAGDEAPTSSTTPASPTSTSPARR